MQDLNVRPVPGNQLFIEFEMVYDSYSMNHTVLRCY